MFSRTTTFSPVWWKLSHTIRHRRVLFAEMGKKFKCQSQDRKVWTKTNGDHRHWSLKRFHIHAGILMLQIRWTAWSKVEPCFMILHKLKRICGEKTSTSCTCCGSKHMKCMRPCCLRSLCLLRTQTENLGWAFFEKMRKNAFHDDLRFDTQMFLVFPSRNLFFQRESFSPFHALGCFFV